MSRVRLVTRWLLQNDPAPAVPSSFQLLSATGAHGFFLSEAPSSPEPRARFPRLCAPAQLLCNAESRRPVRHVLFRRHGGGG